MKRSGLWLAALGTVSVLCGGAGAAQVDTLADAQRLLQQGEAAAALQVAERGAAGNPRDAGLRFLRGVILLDLRRDAEAMAVFEALTQEFPELPEPYNNIALLHARAGRLEAARAALETALRNDPAHAAALRNLGDVQLQLALQAWQSAAALQQADAALERKLRLARELLAPAR